MSSLKSWSLRLKLLALSAVITLICVVAGAYISHSLLERERDISQRSRPQQNYLIMRELISKYQLPAEVVFRIIERQNKKRMRYSVILSDSMNNILDYYPRNLRPTAEFQEYKKFEVAPDRFVTYIDLDLPREFRRRSPPPPPGVHVVGIVAITVSILVGLGLSIIFLTIYVRGKSRQAEIVISKLRAGDLKARFKINQVDESSQLMQKFNDMADQIEELVSNLRQTEKTRMVLLQELAHDLKTPVASLKNLQELLLYKGHLMEEDKRQHAQALAVKEVHYFERLVEDLLFLSGVNDPRYSGNFKELNFQDLIREETELFETEKIHLEITGHGDGRITGDEHLLRRLIKNVFSNASRFARSRINIVLTRESGKLTVLIQDDGPGLDPAQLESFGLKKYSRAMQNNDNISIGLGSVIMKKIMNLHDGEMWVRNRAPSGLEVILTFPV